jgi:hypothetical protein
MSADIDHRFGGFMNDVRVEDAYLKVVPAAGCVHRYLRYEDARAHRG